MFEYTVHKFSLGEEGFVLDRTLLQLQILAFGILAQDIPNPFRPLSNVGTGGFAHTDGEFR